MKTYSAVVYRDDVAAQEAAAESEGVGDTFPTPEAARDAIRRAIARDGWHYGSVHEGEYTPAVFGISPANFESDRDAIPWQVGPTWFDRG
jgi:hypothetical protein